MKTFIQVGTGGFGGYWCRRVIPALSDVAFPVAAVDASSDALANAEFANISVQCRYTDIREALAKHTADFIVLVIPPQFREEYIDLALKANMDILCEKPLASTMDACVRIMRKVHAAGRKLAVTMSHRMEIEKQTVERLVKSGKYGELNYIYSRLNIARDRYNNIDTPERYVTDCLVHNLDTMRGISGSDVRSVYAQCWPHPSEGRFSGMNGFVMMDMLNGTHALLEESFACGSDMDGWSNEHLRVECSNATIIADHCKVSIRSDCGLTNEEDVPYASGKYWDHGLIAREFIAWLDGGHAPMTCLDDNMQCAALMFATIESMSSGRAIDVQEYLRNSLKKY